jgi:hypothetical protein
LKTNLQDASPLIPTRLGGETASSLAGGLANGGTRLTNSTSPLDFDIDVNINIDFGICASRTKEKHVMTMIKPFFEF